jgi:Holliday junction DNA helicase RuvB
MQEQPSEINDVAPTSLKHIIGQRSVVAQVGVALEAAFADNRKFDSALLVGGPGLGKSQLAHVIAAEMAAGLHEVLGQSIASPADLNSLLLTAKAAELDEGRKACPWLISPCCFQRPTSTPCSSRSGIA